MKKFQIKVLNEISDKGLQRLGTNYEINNNLDDVQGIIVRSASMHEIEIPNTLHAIARAGAGVNNIPIDKCSDKGIMVFNTPGANANAVKELAITSLLISSRKIIDGINWVDNLHSDDIAKTVESGKAQFAGPELQGKTLGVIGLGAIGVMVANTAVHLDMEVLGYDPFISVEAAWTLSRSIKKADDLDSLLAQCDYISLHIPLLDSTKNFINKETIQKMKDGIRIINLSRGELADNEAIIEGLKTGKISNYVSDFPNDELLGIKGVIQIPHLGASTPESEENCAIMAVKELKDFLENGNIKNSVNYPSCDMGKMMNTNRITVAHHNIPKMLNKISNILADAGINISNMINKSHGNYAYTMIDVETEINNEQVNAIKNIDGVLKVRVLS